jgi:hypothetical protein
MERSRSLLDIIRKETELDTGLRQYEAATLPDLGSAPIPVPSQ